MASEAKQRDHDLLSFMSTFLITHQRLDLSLTLLSVLIDDASIDVQVRSNKGGYFSVCLARSKDLLEARFLNRNDDLLPEATNLPELVAVKIPRPDGDLNSARSRKMWSSMAMELQILRNKFIKDHPNIVQLLGICWKSVKDGVLMPSFVLEAAEIDLEKFLDNPKAVGYRKVLGLAVDIATGVRALHDVGIIHGDIKPANVLIFKDPQLTYVAKIADFGSSLLRSDIKSPMKLPFGSGFWQAPECRDHLDGDQLTKADVYSVGLVLWRLLAGDMMHLLLDSVKDDGLTRDAFFEHMKRNDEKRIPATVYHCLMRMEDILGPEEKTEPSRSMYSIHKVVDDMASVIMMTLVQPKSRSSIKALLENMRIVMHQYLIWEEFRGLYTEDFKKSGPIKMNAQEQDIWLQPGLDEPTEDDIKRVLRLGRSTEWLNQTFSHIKRGGRVSDLPGMDQVPESVATTHVAETWKRWRKLRDPKPDEAITLRQGRAVLEADSSMGTLRVLPPGIISNVMREVKRVAEDPKEEQARRTEAAWQYSMFNLRTVQLHSKSQGTIDESLAMLLQAAEEGHYGARGIVGHLYVSLRRDFPRSRDIELAWLRDGICHGSETAKRRLQALDPDLYTQATDLLRTRYSGLGIETPPQYWDQKTLPDHELFHETRIRHRIGMDANQGQTVLLCAMSNRLELLKQLTDHGLVNVNHVNEWNESPLLWASRAGHRDVVFHLLSCGADPSVASDERTTPLHFLSSFDDGDIPEVCRRLVEAGAGLEARSKAGHRYRQGLDSTYGDVDGTPLTWAVAANNSVAAQALVTSGADPFDLPGLEISYSDTFGGMSHVSPVWFAAMNHQYYMLKILLRNVAKEKIKDFLNTYQRKFGSNDSSGQDNPIIAWCATYAAQGIGRRVLFHGKYHQEAFVKTFDLLVDYGADTDDVHRLAVQHGQPFVLDYLFGSGKIPRPTPRKWMEFILIAGATQDWITFDVLVRYSQADDLSSEQWHLYYGSFRGLPNNVEYLDVFRKHRDPKTDYYLHYTKALMSGKFILARWFYGTGLCDLTQQVSTSDETILGLLLRRCKSYSNAILQLEQVLKLDLPDSCFWDIAYFPEYQTSSTMANAALRLIVQKWYEPEHLNAQVAEGEFKGRTALHIAALTANVGAVRYLLQEEEESLDLTLLDCNNFSIVDTAAWGLMSQQSRIKLWDLPTEYHKSADLDHWRSVMEILVRLLKAGAKPNKIGLAVTRTEQEKIQVFDLERFKVYTVPFNLEMGPVGLRAEMEAMKGEMGELKGRVAAVEAENSVLREVVNDLQNRFGGPLPSRRVDGVRRRPTSATPSLIERPRGGDNHLKNP
ncbi:serine/threonine protein kinase [Fusarium proliferatum]|nr:serine/threonine protein kinase [Fusarium proliferatum]